MRPFVLLLALLLTACAGTGGDRGAILSSAPFPGAPGGASATRIVYASTDPDGAAIAVSALVITPAGPAPAGGRKVLAWAHPTTGVQRACAPSEGPDPFGQIQGLDRFLAAGYVVVATDYPGLGTDGVHPYLVGASEARAVLDSVRAAQRLPGTGASASFAVWGHSQGRGPRGAARPDPRLCRPGLREQRQRDLSVAARGRPLPRGRARGGCGGGLAGRPLRRAAGERSLPLRKRAPSHS